MDYRYIALNTERRVVNGMVSANSEATAELYLNKMGFKPISVQEARKRLSLEKVLPSFFGIKRQDIIAFSRQLALLLECGVSILQSLQVLQEQTSSKLVRALLGDIITDLRMGKSFSQSLAKHPEAFDVLYCRMMAIGEQTGSLETSLKTVASYLSRQSQSAKKVKTALAYPFMVLLVAVGVIAILTTVVLPQMVSLFEAFKVDLPLPTRVIIGFTRFVNTHGVYLYTGAIGALILGLALSRTRTMVRAVHLFSLKAPLIGPVSLKREMARFSRTVSLLLRAGLPLPEIIQLALQATKNTIFHDALDQIRTSLIQGKPMAAPMADNKLFPRAMVQMVAVGEETGNLDTTLATVSDAYEEEADEKTTALISMLEPAMTVVVGLVVGFVALAIVMPIYTITGAFK